MKSSNKLGKRKGYHLSKQGKWKGDLFREKWYIKEQGVRTRGGASPYKTCWVPPPPPLGLCQLFGNHVEFTIIKGEPILKVENSDELIFFSFQTTLWKGLGWMLFRDSRDSRFVPWQFPDRFFSFFNMSTRKRSRMTRLEWRRRQVFHFQNRRVFLLSQGI